MNIMPVLAGGIIVARARVLAAMPPLSRSFAERSERRITSWNFKASTPGPILHMSSQLLCQNFRRANDPAGYAGYDYYKLLKYSGARLMLCLVYLVIMWVAVWNESDMQLFSEQSHW